MKKTVKVVLISVIVITIILLSLESVILVSVARNGLKHIFDVRTHMKKIALRPLKGSMAIKGFEIFNPPGYKEKTLASISLVLLDFKPKTLFEPGAYFDRIEIKVDKLNIIRGEDGVINLTQMKAFASPQEKSEKPFLADKYIVEIEKVYYIDRTKEEDKQIREINLNKRWEYDDVRDPDNLVNVIAYKVFVGGQIIGVGLELQKLQKKLAKLAEHNKHLAESFEKLRQEHAEKAKEAIKEAVDATVEAVKEGAAVTKEAIGVQVEKTKEAVAEKVEAVKEAAGKTQEAVEGQVEKTVEIIKEKTGDIKESVKTTKEVIGEKIDDIKEALEDKSVKASD